MGHDAKVLLQYDRRPYRMHDWSSYMTSADPDFDTLESSAMQPGEAGLITVYAGGRTGASWRAPRSHGPVPAGLRDALLHRIERAVPGTRVHFNGRGWADLWHRDQWTLGSYAAFGSGQYTRFWNGTAQAEGNIHFAGEATSTYSQGYLNGGVESGDRTAIEVMRKLRIRVPPDLARLPYTPA
jgi:monoamine oxidase